MATFLDILPIEIRNQIYEDLLLYRDGSIMLNFDGNAIDRGEGEKVGLHTAILRTCKQAYAEGSNVLYGHNHFRYCTTVFLSYKNRQYRPLTSVFQKIKHLEIRRDHIWFIPVDICSFVETLAMIIQSLNVLRCSLKTLCLKFFYHSSDVYKEHYRAMRRETLMWISEGAFEKALSGIQVGTSLSITLNCFDEELGATFEDFANAKHFKARWNLKSDLRKTTLLLDDRRKELWDEFSPPGTAIPGLSYDWDSVRYTWTWTITPVIKVTTRKSHKYLETDETASSDEMD